MKKIFTVIATIAVMLFSGTAIAQSYNPADDLSQYKTASELYNYTQVLFVAIAHPNEPFVLYWTTICENLRKFDRAIQEFARRYPDDPRLPAMRVMLANRDALKPALGLSGSTSRGGDGKQVITTTVSSPVGGKKAHAWPAVHVVEKLQRE